MSLFYYHISATHKLMPNMSVHFCMPRKFNFAGKMHVYVEVDGFTTKRTIKQNKAQFLRKWAKVTSTHEMLTLLEEFSD